ncbi:myosin-7-like [Drosophila serrata]|uniref:myosin-7-like n=1 Tax=Drosophila serrata TaxID=7274 RepID=UPI000A1CF945|nr:myosin-7-like [Drosophila serrata]
MSGNNGKSNSNLKETAAKNTLSGLSTEQMAELRKELAKVSESVKQLDISVRTGFSRFAPPHELVGLPKPKQTIPPSEYEEQIVALMESLQKAENELKLKDKVRTDELNALQLEFSKKLKAVEKEHFDKECEYKIKLLEDKNKLLRYGKELSTFTDRCQEDVLRYKDTFRKIVEEKEDLKAQHQEEIAKYQDKEIEDLLEFDNCKKRMHDSHSIELERVRADLELQIQKAEDERNKGLDELAMMKAHIQELQQMYNQLDAEANNLREEKVMLELKVEKELNNAQLKTSGLDDLISENEELKLCLSVAKGVSSTLQEKVDNLQYELLAAQQEISSGDEVMIRLRSDLMQALELKDTMITKLEAAEDKMSQDGIQFEKVIADLNGSIKDLQLKLQYLEDDKEILETKNGKLKVKLRNLRNLLQNQSKEDEANQELAKLREEMESERHRMGELSKECDNLRTELKSRETYMLTEREGMAANISSLVEEKKTMEANISSLNLEKKRNAELIEKFMEQIEYLQTL